MKALIHAQCGGVLKTQGRTRRVYVCTTCGARVDLGVVPDQDAVLGGGGYHTPKAPTLSQRDKDPV